MSLRLHPFRIYYGPADNPLANFYIPALAASVRLRVRQRAKALCRNAERWRTCGWRSSY